MVFAELQRFTPASLEEVAELVREAAARGMGIYPIGGGTSLGYGGRPTKAGWAVSLQQLRGVIDYPARDLTITVGAGLPVAELQAILGQQRQHWAVDVPQPQQATVGGVVACNLSGPRRYAYGAVSESVLALRAVDGQGTIFSAGARVVKNAAGYNLCRLLAGSLGTLGILGEVTLRVQPLPETSTLMVGSLEDWDLADRLLSQLMEGPGLPTAIELAAGPAWADDPLLGPLKPPAKAWLVVGLEGSAKEVCWQVERLQSAWARAGIRYCQRLAEATVPAMWHRLTEFPVRSSPQPLLVNGLPPARLLPEPKPQEPFLVVQAAVLPSRLLPLLVRWLKSDSAVSVLAHAAHGSLIGYFPLAQIEASRWLQEVIFPSVLAEAGHAQVLTAPDEVVLKPSELWTHPPAASRLMQALKNRFDPQAVLNPGRLGFGIE
ncbi:MAG: FAD-binding oxidoreductase [Thermoguttaceae bacterium]|nr:FAD-binding oxidoreductase [Thermoguttaceae bacterium]MDW8036849.1 FAD-binding oxidoreductase [Thermoguttaceae bacterium]